MRKLFAGVWLAIVLILGAAVPTSAQGESAIHGNVTARADGSALAGAVVQLQGGAVSSAMTTTTTVEGQFAFLRLVPGDYVLTVALANFQDERYRLSLKPREVQTLSVALALRPLQESVQVTTAAIPSVFSPGSTHLTAERLAELPLTQRTNLPDAIVAAAPGMIRGHDDFVHIRGHEVALNPSINGVQFWENAHAVFSPGLGVDYIESMNVMTGGYAAEYGNRFGGILDVVTKSGFTVKNRGSVTLGTGSAQRHNVGLEFGGQTGRTGYYVNLSGFMSDRFLSPPSPRSIHNTGRGVRSFGQLDFRANDSDYFKVVMIGDGVNFELPKEERDELLRPDFNNLQRTRSQSLILSWDHVHSTSTLMRTAFYQKWSSVHQFPDTIDQYGAQTDAERTLRTFGIKSDMTRFHGRHTVKGGIDLVLLRPREDLYYLSQPWITFTHLPAVNEPHVHFRGPNRGPGVPRPVVFNGKETGGQASAFLQDKIQLTPNLTVDLGVRVRPVQPGDFGVAREPAGERRLPPSGGDGVVRVVQPLLRSAADRERSREQCRSDEPRVRDRKAVASGARHQGKPVRARRHATDREGHQRRCHELLPCQRRSTAYDALPGFQVLHVRQLRQGQSLRHRDQGRRSADRGSRIVRVSQLCPRSSLVLQPHPRRIYHRSSTPD